MNDLTGQTFTPESKHDRFDPDDLRFHIATTHDIEQTIESTVEDHSGTLTRVAAVIVAVLLNVLGTI